MTWSSFLKVKAAVVIWKSNNKVLLNRNCEINQSQGVGNDREAASL